MSVEDTEISLGFVAKAERAEHLQSRFFPSKVGGKPAWLSPAKLPRAKDQACPVCKKPRVFLLQAYAPLEDDADAFHRTLFVFACLTPACYAKNDGRPLAVFRSQLNRKNDFYSDIPSSMDDMPKGEHTFEELTAADSDARSPLCTVCGCSGSLWCSKCRGPRYCGRDHQLLHWKCGHKTECQPAPSEAASGTKGPLPDTAWSHAISSVASGTLLLPELELLIESESEQLEVEASAGRETDEEEDEAESEDQRLKDYEEFVRSQGSAGALDGTVSTEELTAAAADGVGITDKCFKAFKKRIAIAPEQVLRYQRNGSPLWLTEEHQAADEDIPLCPCGARRSFEFQILPQLLSHLHLDIADAQSVDWATLVVYTCSKSCTTQDGYQAEFVWKQDF